MIICISGLAGSGKTTAASHIVKTLQSHNYKAFHYTSDFIGQSLYPQKYFQMLDDVNLDYSTEELTTIYNGLYLLIEQIFKVNPNSVIVTDGMYRKAAQRLLLRLIANRANSQFKLIKIETEPTLAKERLKERQKNGGHGGRVDPKSYEEPCDKDLIRVYNNKDKELFRKSIDTAFKKLQIPEYFFV